MDSPPNYRREFAKSPHHAWFGLVTLGLGFLSAHPLLLLAGASAYALGWIYAPDLPFFRNWVDGRQQAARLAAARAEVEAFCRRREQLLAELSSSRRQRYHTLAAVCREIEAADLGNPLATGDPVTDPRLRKLEELMWTFLRLLSIEESLERFLETERKEDVPRLARETEASVAELSDEMPALRRDGPAQKLDLKERLLNSRKERLEVLHKRLARIDQAQSNLALVLSEQERLDQQIKLLRAEAVAAKNAQNLSARIDATVEHLDTTNKWISELDEFRDLVGDVPATELRVGFGTTEPPVLPRASSLSPKAAAQTTKRPL